MENSTAAIWMIIILFGFPYVAVALFCLAAAIDWIIEDRKERKVKAMTIKK
jgi:hypothetical protein